MSKFPMVIRPFQTGDEAAFKELNEEWISSLFHIETKDLEVLGDPIGSILEPGGQILMAVREGAAIGCCALIPKGQGVFELGKMAVHPKHRGAGVGRQILVQAIEYARSAGAAGLYLETSSKLPDAIHLYESVGFTRIPAERMEPSPYIRSDIHMEMQF